MWLQRNFKLSFFFQRSMQLFDFSSSIKRSIAWFKLKTDVTCSILFLKTTVHYREVIIAVFYKGDQPGSQDSP